MADGKITVKGRENLCKAHAGEITLPAITQMALGNGGLDESSEPLKVTGEEVTLRNELLRRNVDSVTFPETTTARYSLRLEKADLAGEYISEAGLYNSDGDLVQYETYMSKGKDGNVEFVFTLDEVF